MGDVVARAVGQHLRLLHLVAVIDVVDDADAGLLEFFGRIRRDVIRPVLDVDDLSLLRPRTAHGGKQDKDRNEQSTHDLSSPQAFVRPA